MVAVASLFSCPGAIWRCAVAALILLASAAGAPAAFAQALVARYTPIANFAYQLDCVAHVLQHCVGRADYIKLWSESLGIDPLTSPEVARWRELRREHARMAQPGLAFVQPGWPYATIDPGPRVMAAGFGARDLGDYQSRLSLLMHDALSGEAVAIVAGLYPRFERWWAMGGTPPGAETAERIIKRMAASDIQAELARIRSIYGSPLGAQRVAIVHLMFRPGLLQRDATGGQNNGVHSFAEFIPGEDITYRIPVIAHEYAHFVFGATRSADAASLRNAVLAHGVDVGGPAWGLINEGIATALGNGRVQRLLMDEQAFEAYAAREGSFYADPLIDGAGKALLPLVDEMIAAGRSIQDDGFAARYIAALTQRFGKALNAPAAHLNEVVVLIDPGIEANAVLGVMDRLIRSNSRWEYRTPCCGEDFLRSLRAQSGVARLVAVPGSLVERMEFLPQNARESLRAGMGAGGAAIHVHRPSGEPPLVVIALAGSTPEILDRVFTALAKAEELSEGPIAVGGSGNDDGLTPGPNAVANEVGVKSAAIE